MLNLIVMLIDDNYVNLNYMMLIDVLKQPNKIIKIFRCFLFIPEHKCLVAVENARYDGDNNDEN
jgi:hypothetical protein